VQRINSSQQACVLQQARERGESCPSCDYHELQTDSTLRLYADGGADVRLWCPNDPHPYPDTDPVWYFVLSSEDLRRIGIYTGI
jgi:hypothetical protein